MSGGNNDPIAAAALKGLVVEYPDADELFVDIDEEDDLIVFRRGCALLVDVIEDIQEDMSPSGKPGHYHCRVTLVRPVKDALERIALQAILGSDRVREALSWLSHDKGNLTPSVFFEKPEPK